MQTLSVKPEGGRWWEDKKILENRPLRGPLQRVLLEAEIQVSLLGSVLHHCLLQHLAAADVAEECVDLGPPNSCGRCMVHLTPKSCGSKGLFRATQLRSTPMKAAQYPRQEPAATVAPITPGRSSLKSFPPVSAQVALALRVRRGSPNPPNVMC